MIVVDSDERTLKASIEKDLGEVVKKQLNNFLAKKTANLKSEMITLKSQVN